MKDFRNFNEQQLKNILTFTNALADRIQREQNADFGAMETNDESLQEAEREAVAFAERRRSGLNARSDFGASDEEQTEIDEIRKGIRDYYKRTRKIVRG